MWAKLKSRVESWCPAAAAVLVAVDLWLVGGQLRGAVGTAGYDDALFLKLAHHLVRGEWLGPYDALTLLKVPGYPLWIAGNFFTGLPLSFTEHLAYAAACAIFARAVRPRLGSNLLTLAVFALLLFQPMSFSTSTLRYTRDFLYTSQTLLVVALLLTILERIDSAPRVILRSSLALGLAAGCLWITRDEGVAILPAIGVAGTILLVRTWRAPHPGWAWRLLAVTAALPAAAAIVVPVALVNLRDYGLFTVSEYKRPELNRAMGALSRVEAAQPRPWVIVTTEARERIYPQSAAFRELQPILEGRIGIWGTPGPMMFEWDRTSTEEEKQTGTLLGTICQDSVAWDDAAMHREIMTGWFILALREAVALTGRYPTAPGTMEYYSRLATEIDGACESGRLPCDPPRASLAPPWRNDLLVPTLRRMCRGTARLLSLADMQAFPTIGTEDQLAPFRELTNDHLLPVVSSAPEAPTQRTAWDRWKVERLAAIHEAYRSVMPWAAIFGFSSFGLCLTVARARRSSRLLGVGIILLAVIVPRLALLSFMDVAAFPHALIPLYLLPIYPLMTAFVVLASIDGVRALASFRSTSANG